MSGRTTGRLRYIRSTTAHAIRGNSKLALRYSINTRLGCRTVYGTTGRQGAAHVAAESAGTAVLFRDYWPAGSSGRRRRLRQCSSTFRWTTGRAEQRTDLAGVNHSTRTTRPRDLQGAGRRSSPMHGTRSQALHVISNKARAVYNAQLE